MNLKATNTLTGKKETIDTRKPGQVSIYVCGITPYSDTHLGHVRPLVFWDAVIRYLEYRGFRVTTVQNVTDVNEKVLTRAQLEGLEERKLAEKYFQEYIEVSDRLKVLRMDHYPWVSDHMDQIIQMIEQLIEAGHAYEVDGNVYFDISSAPDYGALSGQALDDLIAGARLGVNAEKRHPADFALWKRIDDEEIPRWHSPWGKGRPGWHIECSAISQAYLGYGFDFHGGGSDLIFPHHENERAQSEALNQEDTPFVRHWLHHGMVTGEEGKMSKSLGNFVTARTLLDAYPPEVIRFFLLSAHYSSPLTYSRDRLEATKTAWERLVNTAEALYSLLSKTATPEDVVLAEQEAASINDATDVLKQQFCDAMDDDFNTPRAIGAIFEGIRRVNGVINASDFVLSPEVYDQLGDFYDQLEISGNILGIWPDVEASGLQTAEGRPGMEADLLNLLVKVREKARSQKLWELADTIRDGLADLEIQIEDTPEGPRIRRGD